MSLTEGSIASSTPTEETIRLGHQLYAYLQQPSVRKPHLDTLLAIKPFVKKYPLPTDTDDSEAPDDLTRQQEDPYHRRTRSESGSRTPPKRFLFCLSGVLTDIYIL